MVFNSLQFLVFFVLITLLFFRFKTQKQRIVLLLIASCYFYMSFIPEYILILGSTIIVDYFAGLQIGRTEGRTRKSWLIVSLIINIGTLAVFKYYNFFIDNIQSAFHASGQSISLPFLKMALPIGLSFHTFQAMSYTIEVHRGNQKPERNFVVYALYVMFYPQLVAGPIERPQNILHQLKEFRVYNWDHVKEGFARMLWGFFKKAVIADRLAMIVDRTFSHTHDSSSLALFAGACFYYFQMYCDFSGYSDIALGAAKIMNIDLMENFNQPFFSKSISEFWRRWHISLYSWFMDYLFNPIVLSLRNLGSASVVFAIMFTFALSGLWHGAAWHHIVYGLLHGVALTFEYFTRKKRKEFFKTKPAFLTNLLGIGATLGFVIFTRIFFRAETVPDAVLYLKNIFSLTAGSNYIGMGRAELIFAVLMILAMLLKEKYSPKHLINNNSRFYSYAVFMIIACYYLGVYTENKFIYFQF